MTKKTLVDLNDCPTQEIWKIWSTRIKDQGPTMMGGTHDRPVGIDTTAMDSSWLLPWGLRFSLALRISDLSWGEG